MFVNIGPAEYNMDESVTTLVYGSRAKEITNNSKKNVETQAQAKLNETYKKMQAQLDLAINTLKRNNIPIPNDLKMETAGELNLIEEDRSLNISKFSDRKPTDLNNDNSMVEQLDY